MHVIHSIFLLLLLRMALFSTNDMRVLIDENDILVTSPPSNSPSNSSEIQTSSFSASSSSTSSGFFILLFATQQSIIFSACKLYFSNFASIYHLGITVIEFFRFLSNQSFFLLSINYISALFFLVSFFSTEASKT